MKSSKSRVSLLSLIVLLKSVAFMKEMLRYVKSFVSPWIFRGSSLASSSLFVRVNKRYRSTTAQIHLKNSSCVVFFVWFKKV